MTAVNISGTFKNDERPMNGLESIAKLKYEHIEVVTGEDAEWVAKKLDERYRARNKREAGPANPLPKPAPMEGQMAIDDGDTPPVDVGVGAEGGASNSTRVDIEIDPWAHLVVDNRDEFAHPVSIRGVDE